MVAWVGNPLAPIATSLFTSVSTNPPPAACAGAVGAGAADVGAECAGMSLAPTTLLGATVMLAKRDRGLLDVARQSSGFDVARLSGFDVARLSGLDVARLSGLDVRTNLELMNGNPM
jgi:hypothetical protein